MDSGPVVPILPPGYYHATSRDDGGAVVHVLMRRQPYNAPAEEREVLRASTIEEVEVAAWRDAAKRVAASAGHLARVAFRLAREEFERRRGRVVGGEPPADPDGPLA